MVMTSTSKEVYINPKLREQYRSLIEGYWHKASIFERKGLEENNVNYLVLAKHNRDLAKGIIDWIVAEEAKYETQK